MGFLREGDPARYHIHPTEKGVSIAVNKLAVPNTSDFNQARMDEIARYLRLPGSFIMPSSDHEWGFGPVLREEESPNPGWVIYSADLPKLYDKKGNWSPKTYQTSATLSTLLTAIEGGRKSSDSAVEQQMKVDLNLNVSTFASAPIYAEIYSPLVKWLRDNIQDKTIIKIITASMQRGFLNMWNDREWKPGQREFRLYWNSPKWLFLSVPGDAADLGPNMDSFVGEDELDDSYRITPHNVDSPYQQLTLLVGLGQIDELATGGYYKQQPEAI